MGIDETMTRLHAEGSVRDTIVVGIWNSPKRFQEYMPEDAMKLVPAGGPRDERRRGHLGQLSAVPCRGVEALIDRRIVRPRGVTEPT